MADPDGSRRFAREKLEQEMKHVADSLQDENLRNLIQSVSTIYSMALETANEDVVTRLQDESRNCLLHAFRVQQTIDKAVMDAKDERLKAKSMEIDAKGMEIELTKLQRELQTIDRSPDIAFRKQCFELAGRGCAEGCMPAGSELRGLFLQAAKELKVPVARDFFHYTSEREGLQESGLNTEISLAFTAAMTLKVSLSTSEIASTVAGKACVTDPVMAIGAEDGNSLKEDFNAVAVEQVATTSKQTRATSTSRPDTLVLNSANSHKGGTVAAMGEDKSTDDMFSEAVEQMVEAWNELWSPYSYCKDMEYVFGFTVCGCVVRIYAICGDAADTAFGYLKSNRDKTFGKVGSLWFLEIAGPFNLRVPSEKCDCLKASSLLGSLIARQKQLKFFGEPNFSSTLSQDLALETRVHLRQNSVRKEVIHLLAGDLPSQYNTLHKLYTDAKLIDAKKKDPEKAESKQKDDCSAPPRKVAKSEAQPEKRHLRSAETTAADGKRHLPTVTLLKVTKKKYTVDLLPRGTPVQLPDQEAPFMEPEDLLRLILHLLLALMYLHSHKIAHRDVRLPNVVLFDGRYYLVDLEEMRKLNEKPQNEELKREAWGPDNVALQNGLFTQASDLYSLGLVLTALLQKHPESNLQEPEDTSQNIRNKLILDKLREFKCQLMREPGVEAFKTSKAAYDDLKTVANPSD